MSYIAQLLLDWWLLSFIACTVAKFQNKESSAVVFLLLALLSDFFSEALLFLCCNIVPTNRKAKSSFLSAFAISQFGLKSLVKFHHVLQLILHF